MAGSIIVASVPGQVSGVQHLRRKYGANAAHHVVEMAVAGGAEAIVTHNRRDFERAELSFPGLRVVTPGAFKAEE